jgi:hypothetical protein
MARDEPRYDVCISFARDRRDYARAVQEALFLRGINCFFDEVQRVQLWGQDLTERFDEVFRKDAQFCVACVSQEWVDRVWPAHERRSALARAVQEPGYFLPVRFDDAEVPGLRPSIGYLDGTQIAPEKMASLIAQKLASRHRNAYLPPVPNRLFAALEIAPNDDEEESKALGRAGGFLADLEELSDEEREMVITVARYGCPCRLPAGIHMPLDRFERITNWDVVRTQRVMRSLRKVAGFSVSLTQKEPSNEDADEFMLEFGWEPMAVGAPHGEATDVANAMIREAGFGTCSDCYASALERLDFSRTSSMLDWSSDESVHFDAGDCPPALRDLVEVLLEDGWTMESTNDQIRFLEPTESGRFHTVPLLDRYDEEWLSLAREILEKIVDENSAMPAE